MPSKPPLSVEKHIGLVLKKLGLTHIYAVGGIPMHVALRSCAAEGLQLVGAHDQRAAVLMACSHNYFAGCQVAAVIVAKGPQVTNTLTGMLVARDNRWPVMVIATGVQRSELQCGAFQSYDALPAVANLADYSVVVEHASRMQVELARAHHHAGSNSPGPVYVEIPENVLVSPLREADPVSIDGNDGATEPVTNDKLRQCAQALFNARRPLLLMGHGIRWGNAYRVLQTLIHSYSIAFVTTSMARGFVAESDPLCCTRSALAAQAGADLIITADTGLGWEFQFGAAISPGTLVFQIGPGLVRHQSSRIDTQVISGNCRDVFSSLKSELERLSGGSAPLRDEAWLRQLAQSHKTKLHELDNLGRSLGEQISPYQLAKAVDRATSKNALIILDANVTMRAADLILSPDRPLTHLTAGRDGYMGGGIPYGIASLMQDPGRTTVVLTGDFAIGQSIMELETAARFNLPLVVIVSNNGAASGGISEYSEYRTSFTRFMPDIGYDQIALALGLQGALAKSESQLDARVDEAIRLARANKKPFVLNVRVASDCALPPRL